MACVRVIECENRADCIAIAPDGHLLAIGAWNGGVQLLDARTGGTVQINENLFTTVISVAFSLTSPLLLAAAGYSTSNTIQVWDCSGGGTCVATLRGLSESINHVTFSPDGRLLATASADKTVRLWHTNNWGAPPDVLEGHTLFVSCVSFSCDGRLLASCSFDYTVRLWRISDNTAASPSAAYPVLEFVQQHQLLVFSPVDSCMLAYNSPDGPIVLARVDAGAITMEHTLRGHVKTAVSMAFSPCGQTLVSASYDRSMRLWSVASGTCLRVIQKLEWIDCEWINCATVVGFFPNGKQVASCSWGKVVRIWTLCTWSDRTHYLFGTPLKNKIFQLMCVRARLLAVGDKPELPIELWLMVFEQLALIL